MTANMEIGWYIVDHPAETILNGSIIHITEFVKPTPEDSIKGKRYVKGTVKAPREDKGVTLGDDAFVFDSTDKKEKSIKFMSSDNGLYSVTIKPIKEGGRRRKTFRNKRKLRLRKTKSANKRR
jgi:hypothetical protein